MLICKNTSSACSSIFVYLPAGGLFRDKSTGTINHKVINKSVLEFWNARCHWFLPQNAGINSTRPNVISRVKRRFIYLGQFENQGKKHEDYLGQKRKPAKPSSPSHCLHFGIQGTYFITGVTKIFGCLAKIRFLYHTRDCSRRLHRNSSLHR